MHSQSTGPWEKHEVPEVKWKRTDFMLLSGPVIDAFVYVDLA